MIFIITRKDNMFDPLWSMYIDDKVEEYEKDRNYEGLWVNRRLSINELNQPIKKIKNGKTVPESDNIPNESIKNGGNTMREILFNLFDNVMCTEDTPEQWNTGVISSLYKGRRKPRRYDKHVRYKCF